MPLIAINCIILSRVESYVQNNKADMSVLDGLGMGLGFTAALLLLGCLREFFGANQLFGWSVLPGFQPASVMLLAPGGFFVFAAVLACRNWYVNRKKGGVQ